MQQRGYYVYPILLFKIIIQSPISKIHGMLNIIMVTFIHSYHTQIHKKIHAIQIIGISVYVCPRNTYYCHMIYFVEVLLKNLSVIRLKNLTKKVN